MNNIESTIINFIKTYPIKARRNGICCIGTTVDAAQHNSPDDMAGYTAKSVSSKNCKIEIL